MSRVKQVFDILRARQAVVVVDPVADTFVLRGQAQQAGLSAAERSVLAAMLARKDYRAQILYSLYLAGRAQAGEAAPDVLRCPGCPMRGHAAVELFGQRVVCDGAQPCSGGGAVEYRFLSPTLPGKESG